MYLNGCDLKTQGILDHVYTVCTNLRLGLLKGLQKTVVIPIISPVGFTRLKPTALPLVFALVVTCFLQAATIR